jgi:perosamine synthetase
MNHSKIIKTIRNQFPGLDRIGLHEPQFFGNEKKYLAETIESTFVSSVGAFVDRFELDFASFTQTSKAVAVVNGTAALQVALRLAGVKKEEEVLTQALTFVATSNSILYNQAFPVFLDVDLDTMGMSPKALNTFLEEYGELRKEGCFNKSSGRRIAACMPMHTFGFMCRIDQILAICKTWNIPVVEDAAEALGSSYKGQAAGSFGALAAFSFNGNKIITAGGGGAIVSSNPDLARKAKYLTTTAKVPHPWAYEHDELGYNFRMPNLNAALLCAQLEQFELLKKSKKELFEGYKNSFSESGIKLKPIPDDTDWNYWLISLEMENEKERDSFLKESNENGVMTRPIWQLMYKLPMYEHCQRDDQQNAEFLEQRIVNIPSSARIAS